MMKKIEMALFIITGLALIGFMLCQKNLPVAAKGGVAPEVPSLTLFNWESFTDPEVLAAFEKETGIKVNLEEYKTKDQMIQSMQDHPGRYDVALVAGDILSNMKNKNELCKLDLTRMPNTRGVNPSFRRHPDYAQPYLIGTVGLGINTRCVDPQANSWTVLWDPRYKGKIALLDDTHELMILLMFARGLLPDSLSLEMLGSLEKDIWKLKENGAVLGDTLANAALLAQGDKWIVQAWSGDIIAAKGSCVDQVKYVLPREGFSLEADYFVVPIAAAHPQAAQQLINYLLRPLHMAKAANRFCYYPAVQGCDRFLDDFWREKPGIYPSPDILHKGEFLPPLEDSLRQECIRLCQILK